MDDEPNPFSDESQTGKSKHSQLAEPEENPFEQRLNVNDLQRREQELLKREHELTKREKALEQGNVNLGGEKYVLKKANNWPSRCLPITYHDITEDVPMAQRHLVRSLYGMLILDWVALIWNFVALFILYLKDTSNSGGLHCLFAIIYAGFGIPGAWVFWYRPIYEACRDNASRKYFCYFCNFFCHILWCCLSILGIPDIHMLGVFWLIKLMADGNKTGILLGFIAIILWGAELFGAIVLLKKVHHSWSSGGGAAQMKADVGKVVVKTAAENPQLVKQVIATSV